MPMCILFVGGFSGGGDVLIFVVKKSACFRLCLLGNGSFQFKKEGIDKRKIFTNTSFSVEKIIQLNAFQTKEDQEIELTFNVISGEL